MSNLSFWKGAALSSALVLVLCGVAQAAGTAPSPPPRREPPPEIPAGERKPIGADEAAKAARAEAEKLYAKGYEEAQAGKKEALAGEARGAKKRFGKALKSFEAAVERDPAHYQAWNMIGYCARNLGDLKRAFEAYDKSLSIRPDYDEAHEYRGEAYLLSGDLAKAKVELAWLRAHDSDEADELAEKIAEAEKKTAPLPGKQAEAGSAPASGAPR